MIKLRNMFGSAELQANIVRFFLKKVTIAMYICFLCIYMIAGYILCAQRKGVTITSPSHEIIIIFYMKKGSRWAHISWLMTNFKIEFDYAEFGIVKARASWTFNKKKISMNTKATFSLNVLEAPKQFFY